MGGDPEAALEIEGLSVAYSGDAITAIEDVTMRVEQGTTVALLGPNGAGKTSLLRAITGLLSEHGGRIRSGRIHYGTHDLTRARPSRIVRLGVSQVMEGRRIFKPLTVEENLRAASYVRKDRERRRARTREVFDMFPILADRRAMTAGLLSGGEQQMLAIGRALMQEPVLLLLDEPSLGLAPLIVEQIRDHIREINETGTTVVLIEQNAAMALSISSYAYVISSGQIVAEGSPSELMRGSDVQALYLGGSADPGDLTPAEAASAVGDVQ